MEPLVLIHLLMTKVPEEVVVVVVLVPEVVVELHRDMS
jgi:hypothetical protein